MDHHVRSQTGEDACFTHHECFKIRTPPLGEAVSDFPVVVDPVGCVELARVTRWSQAVIQATLEALQLVFAGF
jgi:hypothetical protein